MIESLWAKPFHCWSSWIPVARLDTEISPEVHCGCIWLWISEDVVFLHWSALFSPMFLHSSGLEKWSSVRFSCHQFLVYCYYHCGYFWVQKTSKKNPNQNKKPYLTSQTIILPAWWMIEKDHFIMEIKHVTVSGTLWSICFSCAMRFHSRVMIPRCST